MLRSTFNRVCCPFRCMFRSRALPCSTWILTRASERHHCMSSTKAPQRLKTLAVDAEQSFWISGNVVRSRKARDLSRKQSACRLRTNTTASRIQRVGFQGMKVGLGRIQVPGRSVRAWCCAAVSDLNLEHANAATRVARAGFARPISLDWNPVEFHGIRTEDLRALFWRQVAKPARHDRSSRGCSTVKPASCAQGRRARLPTSRRSHPSVHA